MGKGSINNDVEIENLRYKLLAIAVDIISHIEQLKKNIQSNPLIDKRFLHHPILTEIKQLIKKWHLCVKKIVGLLLGGKNDVEY